MKMFSLKNKVIVITGACGLLGKEHVKAIAKSGGIPVLIDLNQKDIIDWFYNGIASVLRQAHQVSIISQSGQLRTYVAVVAAGLVLTIAVFLGILIP